MKNSQEKSSEQRKRFMDTARKLGADESGEAFERAFGKIVPPKHPKQTHEPEPKAKRPRK